MTIQAQTEKLMVPKKKPDLTNYDSDIIARMITTEASGSESKGYDQNEMAAMAWVVFNRVNKG